MAYYDALIAAWNSTTQPPTGVTGDGLVPSDSTQGKLDKINAWTVTGQVPTDFTLTGNDLFNCIIFSEFNALQAGQKTNLMDMLKIDGPMACGTDNNNKMAWGMMSNFFAANSQTLAAVKALAKARTGFWCEYHGYPLNGTGTAGGLTLNDAQNAGLV